MRLSQRAQICFRGFGGAGLFSSRVSFSSRLWLYALIPPRHSVLPKDLVQATALRALERSSQFVVGTRLDRWLFSILRSIWLNQLRAQRVRTGHGLLDAEDVLVAEGVEQIETNILAGQVLKQAMGLPEAQRETLLLVYVEGFTYQEAANVLDVPIGTVMSRLATVRLKLGGLEALASKNKDLASKNKDQDAN